MFAISVGIYLAEISITSWKTVIMITSQIAHWNSDRLLSRIYSTSKSIK